MGTRVAAVEAFYRSMREFDVDALLGSLDANFVCHVTSGLPAIGGIHQGPKTVLSDCWIPAFEQFGVTLEPAAIFNADGGRVVATGRYRGHPPGGSAFTAEFVHVFQLQGSKIVELRQVTDSKKWVDALP